MRKLALPGALAVAVALVAGCSGGIRNTTTPRTSTDMLLISTAAERALKSYDTKELAGKRVFIDDTKYESLDKKYVMSALRHLLAKSDVTISAKADPKTEEVADGADLVLQLRNASLGIWDGDFTLGIPSLKIGDEDSDYALPPLYFFRRLSEQGFAKFQLWLMDPATRTFVSRSGDLWGRAFYNQWWLLGAGPFDGSNDIYPDIEFPDWVPGSSDSSSDSEGN